MKTQCTADQLEFHALERRQIVGKFDGGEISSDGGSLLLREVERRTGLLGRLSRCFDDYRKAELIEHTVESLVKQRVFALALGYEDLNDHETLRQDTLLAAVCDKGDPTGNARQREQDKGKALAGKSTLNRLELTPRDADETERYKKIVANSEAIDTLLVDYFLESFESPPQEIVLDVDATDDPLHGHQEGRFFHGYYGCYCYLPLYIFCGEQLLCARLRESGQDGAAGTVEELARIVERIRARWPRVRIILRGDSGFCRDSIMTWCEGHGVDYVLGIAKNDRLKAAIESEMAQAKALYETTQQPGRLFKDFRYRTRKTWSCERRVVGKAEYLSKGENPRFIVTSLTDDEYSACALYEEFYCARGDMENRIKEQQLCMFADRTSTALMHSNQLRLYFSSFAYVLVQSLRRLALTGTEMANAQCSTIRLKLFKIGAQVRVTVRKVWIAFSESYPYRQLFQQVFDKLQQIPLRC